MVSLTSSSGGYINGRNSANLELLIDKTSSIYLYVKLKALASWIFLSFTSFWRNSDSYAYKNKSARRYDYLFPLMLTFFVLEFRHTIKNDWGPPVPSFLTNRMTIGLPVYPDYVNLTLFFFCFMSTNFDIKIYGVNLDAFFYLFFSKCTFFVSDFPNSSTYSALSKKFPLNLLSHYKQC